MNLAMVLLTGVLAVATIVLAWATIKYVRAIQQPLLSGYFETDRTWIYLVVQNTGTDVAFDTKFSIDLTRAELDDIFGPNLHGQRYIVFEDLSFLDVIHQVVPGQRIHHQWLFLNFALRDRKPRPCTLTIEYRTRWGERRQALVPFDVRVFGTYEEAHQPTPEPLETIAAMLKKIQQHLESLARAGKGNAA
jgi:hypothetical protein